MPGIVGLISRMPRERAERELGRMLDTLRHESSYVAGTWIDERLGVYAGWVVRAGAFADGMPLVNEHEDRVLLFSGEEYPEPGTPARLRAGGHQVAAGGSGYLVHLSEEDRAFPAGLNGRFHGLLADRPAGTAMLFNDRYGIHRLYYHEGRDAVYFAPEAKAILEVRPELRTVDPRGLGEFVSCGCVLENRTLFKDIHVLPPAASWTFRAGALERKGAYFAPAEWESQETDAAEPYYHALRETFARILPRYFAGPERVGVSLTGGLDSRIIMAWHQAPAGELPCYSFGGMFRDCRDVQVARLVANACDQPHQVIPVAGEFLSQFGHYAERTVFLTDGCVDVSHSPDLYANERAAGIAPVRMTGNYGGEVLRQVRAFKPRRMAEGLFSDGLTPFLAQAGATYDSLLGGHPLSFAVFRQAPWHHYGLLSLEQTQLSLRSPYLDNEFVRTVFRAPKSALADNDVSLRLIGDGNPALLRIPTDRGLTGYRNAVSAALSRGLLEFTFKAEYAYDYGMPQRVARFDQLASPLKLERLFLGRHKFYHFRTWYKNALAPYIQQVLLDPAALSRPYVERRTVEALVRRHVGGFGNYTTELHKLLTLELVHQSFVDAAPRRAAASPDRQPVMSR